MRSDGVVGADRHSPPRTHSDSLRWAILWGATFVALGAFDLWRHGRHDGSTLSESVRFVFQTDTEAGRVVFETSLGRLHHILLKHILD
jgi:hypothetical protein